MESDEERINDLDKVLADRNYEALMEMIDVLEFDIERIVSLLFIFEPDETYRLIERVIDTQRLNLNDVLGVVFVYLDMCHPEQINDGVNCDLNPQPNLQRPINVEVLNLLLSNIIPIPDLELPEVEHGWYPRITTLYKVLYQRELYPSIIITASKIPLLIGDPELLNNIERTILTTRGLSLEEKSASMAIRRGDFVLPPHLQAKHRGLLQIDLLHLKLKILQQRQEELCAVDQRLCQKLVERLEAIDRMLDISSIYRLAN